MRKSGYQTWAVGKWHLGHAHRALCPNARGFDQFYGFLNAGIDYFTHVSYGGLDWQRNGISVRENGYSTQLLGAEAVRRIRERDRCRPFFLYLAFNAPHTPLQAPQQYVERVAHIAAEDRRLYAAALGSMDEQIGRVAATLVEEGIDGDTMVLFLGDNGGPRAGGNCRPFRGWKGSVNEGGLRVPAFLRWPQALPSSRTGLVSSIFDVFPTLAAAARVKPQGAELLDGVNLWPTIVHGESITRNPLFFGVKRNEGGARQFALIDDGWKLIQEADAGGTLVRSSLFELREDPAESHDVTAAKPAKVKELTAQIETWKRLHPAVDIDSSMRPHPGWLPPRDYAAAALGYEVAPDTRPAI